MSDEPRRGGPWGVEVAEPPARAWRVVGESLAGTSHFGTGRDCQDAHEWCLLEEELLVIAVADGAGSAHS